MKNGLVPGSCLVQFLVVILLKGVVEGKCIHLMQWKLGPRRRRFLTATLLIEQLAVEKYLSEGLLLGLLGSDFIITFRATEVCLS